VPRHANSRITLDIYTQAPTPAKREAQSRVANLILPKKVVVGESLTNPSRPSLSAVITLVASCSNWNPTGTYSVLHTFPAFREDGFAPRGGLIRDAAGNLYGTTYSGGDYNGVVFKLAF
jgi:hypothetical protein